METGGTDHVQKSDERSKNWGCCDWGRPSDSNPVYDKYKDRRCEATVEQILRLEAAGCEIIRCAVPTMEAAEALKEIKKQIHIPLVADIHFDYRLAIAAIENGADKIRINPGNIGAEERVQAVVDKAKEYNVPIRVGVNSGSLGETSVWRNTAVLRQKGSWRVLWTKFI